MCYTTAIHQEWNNVYTWFQKFPVEGAKVPVCHISSLLQFLSFFLKFCWLSWLSLTPKLRTKVTGPCPLPLYTHYHDILWEGNNSKIVQIWNIQLVYSLNLPQKQSKELQQLFQNKQQWKAVSEQKEDVLNDLLDPRVMQNWKKIEIRDFIENLSNKLCKSAIQMIC